MGNFEKLSVLVIGVIIVMILVVALYTWTDDPAAEEQLKSSVNGSGRIENTPKEPTKKDPWGPWGAPSPVQPPKAVKVVTQRTDKPELPITDQVGKLAAKPPVEEPPVPSDERTYEVQQGDTLGGIALKVMGSTKYWKLLAERNDVDPMKLRLGMTLVIPAVDGAPVAPNKSTADVASAGGSAKPGASYTVRKGDTIQKISQSAYRSIERWTDIWFANMERITDPRDLRPGMKIEIPN